jgi:RNA polymerase sigma-70 factor (ECF subfamily)
MAVEPPAAPGVEGHATVGYGFERTRWTLVRRAVVTGEHTDETRQALREWVELYRPALVAWIKRSRGLSSDRAEEVVDDFLLRVIERNLLARADPARGRLRSFLCRCLWNHVASLDRRSRREVPLGEEDDGAPVSSVDPVADRVFDRTCAQSLVARATATVFAERYAADPRKAALFAELLRWILSDADGETAAAVGARVGRTANAVHQAAHVLRGYLREQIRTDVAKTLMRPEDVDDEVRLLLAALEEET